MIINKLKSKFVEEIDTNIKRIEKLMDCDDKSCSCCASAEMQDDINGLKELKEHINNFND